MIGPLATSVQALYALFLIGVGGYGMFSLGWELSAFYGLDIEALRAEDTGTTLLNQLRFLKATELTFGLFALFYRRDIMAGGLATTVFLYGLALGAFARLLSWGMDGMPSHLFIWFPLLEMLIFALVYLNARQVQAKR